MTLDTVHAERRHNLDRLAELITGRASVDFEFKRAVGAMTEDLTYLSDALGDDNQVWRLNRAFHTVHVPSLLTIMSMLETVDGMNSVSEEDGHQIYSSIHRAAQLAQEARRRIERAAFETAKVELDVLADYAPKPSTEFKKSSFFERTVNNVLSASESTLQTAKMSAGALPGVFNRVKDGMAENLDRASAVPSLASNFQKTLAGVVTDNVSNPINMRLQASSKALKHGVGAGVGLGVAAAVLFPPLLPVSAAGAVLAAMRGWRKEMEAARKLNDAERDKRLEELKEERKAALLKLTNGASSLQMDTDEVSLTVDAEAGEADAVILKGEHSGRRWSELDAGEKIEVASMLAYCGAHVIASILNLTS